MLSAHDYTRIAVEAYRDPRTVAACYAGRRVNAFSMAAVCAAAAKLGYPPPGAAPAPENANGARTGQGGRRPHEHEIDHGEPTAAR
jgi:hypothetical protein